MNEGNKVKYSKRPTTPPQEDEATVFYQDSRTVYSEDGEKFVKMSRVNGFDFVFDHITDVCVLDGTKYICDEAFAELDNLRTIAIPSSVTHIGDSAFLRCKSLESIRIPDSVQFIGLHAFADCSSLRRFESIFASEDGRCLVINNELVAVAPCDLEELHIPESVCSIAPGVFASCPDLKSVFLPDTLSTFHYGCFRRCSALKTIYSKYASTDNKCIIIDGKLILCIENELAIYSIPDGVITIGRGAFGGNVSIKELYLPSTVRIIDVGAFASCTSLKHISIPNRVESIGHGAFSFCKNLQDIILPDSVVDLGASSFYGCKSLKTAKLSNRLSSIEREMFYDCSSLLYFTIPDSVTAIGEKAFYQCSNLEAVLLPAGLTVIEEETFNGCKSLKHIELPASIHTIKRYSFWMCNSLKKVSFPSSLHTLETESFGYCKALEEVDLSICLELTEIETEVFSSCSGIKRLLLPKGIRIIKEGAFQDCSNLETLTIPESVKVIESKAFCGCGFKTVFFQNTDIRIDVEAFRFCRKFETVFIPYGTLSIFEPLIQSLATINFTGHMSFVEVGESISDVKNETKRILSDAFISKPLFKLGRCSRDYDRTCEMVYVINNGGQSKRAPITAEIVYCHGCTGCVQIGNKIVFNWPGDKWCYNETKSIVFPDSVSTLLDGIGLIEDKNTIKELLAFALQLLRREIDDKGITIDSELDSIIGYELSDKVRKFWECTLYDSGKDPSGPASTTLLPDEQDRASISLLKVLIQLLGEYLS